MKSPHLIFLLSINVFLNSCDYMTRPDEAKMIVDSTDSITIILPVDTIVPDTPAVATETKVSMADSTLFIIDRSNFVNFAKTLIAVPYKYASSDPSAGFDCSGFITYVFNHFNFTVPRSSIDFTNYGRPIEKAYARPGDLILFTGTDPAVRVVGHMGIVVENSDSLRFIHSSSGKANGVTITALNDYYMKRFVKVISVFK